MDQEYARKVLYSVHVSNIPCHFTPEKLEDIFSAAGHVLEVYLAGASHSLSKFNYAFVRYKTKEEVLKAVELCNNISVDNFKLIVALSIDTSSRVKSPTTTSYRNRNSRTKSIVRESMPRLERNKFTVLASDERHIQQKLKASLNFLSGNKKHSEMLTIDNSHDMKEFMKELRDVFVETSNVPFGVCADPITIRGDDITKSTLEDIIIRYHDNSSFKVPFKDIDIDISRGNVLSEKDELKLFSSLSPS